MTTDCGKKIVSALFQWTCPHLLPPLEQDDFRIRAAVAVFRDQKVRLVGEDSVAPMAARFMDLVSEVDFVVIPEPHSLSAGEGVRKIRESTFEGVQLGDRLHVRNSERIERRHQLFLEFLEGICAALAAVRRNTFRAERTSAGFSTSFAIRTH